LVSVSTDQKLLAAEGADHFWLDKDFYFIDSCYLDKLLINKQWFFHSLDFSLKLRLLAGKNKQNKQFY
jgi:hypothetical protein